MLYHSVLSWIFVYCKDMEWEGIIREAKSVLTVLHWCFNTAIEVTEDRASIFTNFRQYGLNRPELIRMDSSRPCFRKVEFFDAIVCDPPYGSTCH